MFSVSLPKFKIIQKLIDRLNLVIRNLSGMMVIRLLIPRNLRKEGLIKQILTLLKLLCLKQGYGYNGACYDDYYERADTGLIWVGSHQVAQAHSGRRCNGFMQYAMLIVISFIMLSVMFIMVPRASVSAGRVVEVLKLNQLLRI